jgi:molybdopterin-dependent oxidoreductase alpha subunit
MPKVSRRWRPSIWASWKPFGLGEPRANGFGEVFRAIAENRDQLGYAWRILRHGVCDGCALGTSGLSDWTMPGVHLCNVRLRLLRLNTMPALDPAALADVAALRGRSGAELRALGRLPVPMLRRVGERGFRRVGWDEAMGLLVERVRQAAPARLGFYLTSRGLANETYYVAQKAVRALGTSSIDNAARVCHSPSTVALKSGVGAGATTCSYADWLAAELIVFIGSNPANNQPVAMKYLHYARRAGVKVVVVNTYREPGMERYWVPSVVESALFGTKISDRFYPVATGGDVAFLNGVLKHLVARGLVDQDFVAAHTTGFAELTGSLAAQPWDELERRSGATRQDMEDLAERVGRARRAIFVWSMGITQHATGEDNVRAIINLALSRGFVGREGCGLMPIRGHSGVQGGAEMGAYSTVLPGGQPINAENAARLSALWGFEVPATRGLTAPEMMDAAGRRDLDVLFSVGGSFHEILPQPERVRAALESIPLRVHMDIVASEQMLMEPGEAVLILPATTRYEARGGVTETSTERRVIFSPEIPGPRLAEARDEWRVLMELAERVRPDRAAAVHFESTADIRRDIARTIPAYQGIERLEREGDQFQIGGPHLCAGWRFATPDGKAHFSTLWPRSLERPAGTFAVSTRRGKQFNSMVQEAEDPVTAARRDSVFMSPDDARALALAEGDRVALVSEDGRLHGVVHLAPVTPGTLQVHWPEAQVLLPDDPARRGPASGIPDYNAIVRVEQLGAERGTGAPAHAAAPASGPARGVATAPPPRPAPTPGVGQQPAVRQGPG